MRAQSHSRNVPTLPIVSALLAGAAIGVAGKVFCDSRMRRRLSARTRASAAVATDLFTSASMNDAPMALVRPAPPVVSLVEPVVAAPIDPEQLIRDARQSFNGVVTDPQAIDVFCSEGRIILKGSAFRDEVQPLLDSVQAVPGVNGVENQLTEIDNIDMSDPLDVAPTEEATDFAAVSEAEAPAESDAIDPDHEAHFAMETPSMGSIVPPVVSEVPPLMELSPEEEQDQQNRA